MLIIAGHLTIADGQRDVYLAGCHDVVTAARETPGCLDFVLSADLLEPGRINVFERWATDEDLERFRGSGPSVEQAASILGAEVARYTVGAVSPP